MNSQYLQSIISESLIKIASSGLIFFVGLSWKSLLWPTVVRIWYPGTRLASRYRGEFMLNGKQRTEIVDLHQRAYRVWGTITSPESGEGVFEFEGTLADNVLRATYNGFAKPPSRGSILLTIIPGASNSLLTGRFIQPTQSGLVCEEYRWIPSAA